MASRTSAELGAVFHLTEGGLDEFEPEPEVERGHSWRRVPSPTAVDRLRWDPCVTPPPRARLWPIVVPVVLAAAIAGGVVSRLDRSDRVPGVATPAAPPPSPVSIEPVSPIKSALSIVPPAPPASEPSPSPALERAPSEPSLEPTLAAVSRAYRNRNPSELATVWPGADTAALERSFSGVRYQSLSFDRCSARANGRESLVASCQVSIATAPEEGDPALQRRRESWTLVLNRAGESWAIAGVSAQAVP